MIKKPLLLLPLSMLLVLSSCGDNASSIIDDVKLDEAIVNSLDEKYVPDVDKIKPLSGKIDVFMVLGKLLPGMKAVANEYMRLHNNEVYVYVDENQSSSSYADNLKNNLNSDTSDWDIVQGNFQNNLIKTKGINMFSTVSQKNPYAGKGIYWDEVLSKDAYQTDKSMSDSSVYTLNSEFLTTGWFVQSEALKAASDKGYLNSLGKAENPITFDDLINLCQHMVEAGYSNPLGLSGDASSISSSQFAWLFRVYGDQYYREENFKIMPKVGDYNYSETADKYEQKDEDQQPESSRYYNPSSTRFMNAIFDKTSENYIGATSAKYGEFINQFKKMVPFVGPSFKSLKHDEVRDVFQYQTSGKNSPQIFLDYSGYYLTHTADSESVGQIDCFDYPYMVGENVTYKCVRDVGGNGGYLSIVHHDNEQDELNIDFLKFFMSPYGQSIYYRALEKNGTAPDGLSTIRDANGNSIFSVPASWEEFFTSNKLPFNGLCDVSQFTNNLVYHFSGDVKTVAKNKDLVWDLFDNKITISKYQDDWYSCLFTAYEELCEVSGWDKNMYKNPSKDPTC